MNEQTSEFLDGIITLLVERITAQVHAVLRKNIPTLMSSDEFDLRIDARIAAAQEFINKQQFRSDEELRLTVRQIARDAVSDMDFTETINGVLRGNEYTTRDYVRAYVQEYMRDNAVGMTDVTSIIDDWADDNLDEHIKRYIRNNVSVNIDC
jgi:hypothetical protein